MTPVVDAFVAEQTAEIKRLAARSGADIIDIGKRLLAVKGRLTHGEFTPWIEREFGWTPQTSRNFMRVAAVFGENENGFRFDAKALYALASGDVPDEVREQFVRQAEAGEEVRYRDVRDAIAAVRPTTEVACLTCGEFFSEPVWHCDVCDHHWDFGCDDCGNCHEGVRPNVEPDDELRTRHPERGKRPASLSSAMAQQSLNETREWVKSLTPENKAGLLSFSEGMEKPAVIQTLAGASARVLRAGNEIEQLRTDVLLETLKDLEVQEHYQSVIIASMELASYMTELVRKDEDQPKIRRIK